MSRAQWSLAAGGLSSPETDPFSSAVRPSLRGVPGLTECDSVTSWDCWVYIRHIERTGEAQRGEAVGPGDPGDFCCSRDLNLQDGCNGPGGLQAVPTITYRLIGDHVWPLS